MSRRSTAPLETSSWPARRCKRYHSEDESIFSQYIFDKDLPMNTHEGKVSSTRRGGSSLLRLSVEARMRQGKALREKVSRTSHGKWAAPPGRPDPIVVLRHSDRGRLSELLPIRYDRMQQSPFAFFRGSAAVMAWDLSKTPPTGFRVQVCGDCHAANFGGFASPERRLLFDINDFDETSARSCRSGVWP